MRRKYSASVPQDYNIGQVVYLDNHPKIVLRKNQIIDGVLITNSQVRKNELALIKVDIEKTWPEKIILDDRAEIYIKTNKKFKKLILSNEDVYFFPGIERSVEGNGLWYFICVVLIGFLLVKSSWIKKWFSFHLLRKRITEAVYQQDSLKLFKLTSTMNVEKRVDVDLLELKVFVQDNCFRSDTEYFFNECKRIIR